MPPRDKAMPCPKCGKPIQPDAPNCWFCGEVFDAIFCPRCFSRLKRGLVVCWFCGADLHASESILPRDAPALPKDQPPQSDGIQRSPMPQPSVEPQSIPTTRKCQNCDADVSVVARRCPACNELLGPSQGMNQWDEPRLVQPHRAGSLLPLAVASLFCCGIIIGPIVAVAATNDLNAMQERRMDPAGEGSTRAAQLIAMIATALHAILIFWRLSILMV